MSSTVCYEEVDAYCRDYFNSPVGVLAQTKPDDWARKYLKSWLDDGKGLIHSDALIQACDEAIKEYNKSSGIKRRLLRLFSPISRLKTYHAMLTLREALSDAVTNKTALD